MFLVGVDVVGVGVAVASRAFYNVSAPNLVEVSSEVVRRNALPGLRGSSLGFVEK